MLLTIPRVLDAGQLARVRELLSSARFVDGRLSAGQHARRVKHNEEIPMDARELEELNRLVMGSLVQRPEYQNGALPHRVAVPFYARYTEGMGYGTHIDDPVMGPAQGRYRTDVSLTVFLNEPEEYDGGELVIQAVYGEQQVKLAAGDAVMYPSGSLHRVNEVTRGERLVAVTWIQSLVPDPAQRELLYGLNQAREALMKHQPDAEETARVDRAYINLVRMWTQI